jgi:hypothetical protein
MRPRNRSRANSAASIVALALAGLGERVASSARARAALASASAWDRAVSASSSSVPSCSLDSVLVSASVSFFSIVDMPPPLSVVSLRVEVCALSGLPGRVTGLEASITGIVCVCLAHQPVTSANQSAGCAVDSAARVFKMRLIWIGTGGLAVLTTGCAMPSVFRILAGVFGLKAGCLLSRVWPVWWMFPTFAFCFVVGSMSVGNEAVAISKFGVAQDITTVRSSKRFPDSSIRISKSQRTVLRGWLSPVSRPVRSPAPSMQHESDVRLVHSRSSRQPFRLNRPQVPSE